MLPLLWFVWPCSPASCLRSPLCMQAGAGRAGARKRRGKAPSKAEMLDAARAKAEQRAALQGTREGRVSCSMQVERLTAVRLRSFCLLRHAACAGRIRAGRLEVGHGTCARRACAGRPQAAVQVC